MYVYPAGDLDLPENLLNLLGSFWAHTYDGVDLVASLLYARARLEVESLSQLQAIVSAVSRQTVPIFDTPRWAPLLLLESQRGVGLAGLTFGAGAVFGVTPIPFGGSTGESRYPAPVDLIGAPLLVNRFAAPSVTLCEGIDYFVQGGVLSFTVDPFDNPLIPVQEIWENGTVVDHQATLWAFFPAFDQRYMTRLFGYAVQLSGPSTTLFRALVNAVYDAALQGGTAATTQAFLSAATGVALVRNPVERVEDLFTDSRGLCVVTDLEVYRYDMSATPLVAVGDPVYGGDPLVDTLLISEFSHGEIPEDLQALALGREVLPDEYFGELVFSNTDSAVELVYDDSGRAKVSFPLSGFPVDIQHFWDDVHVRGIRAGKTLAQYLDLRAVPIGEPTSASLPATINPLGFLCSNILRDNTVLVRVKLPGLAPNAPGLHHLRLLPQLLPPQTRVIVLIMLGYRDSPVTMDGPGDLLRPGYSEFAGLFLGSSASESIDPTIMVTETAKLVPASGRCS